MAFFDALRLTLAVTLLGGGAFFAFYLRGFFLLHPIRTLREALKKEKRGGISPLRALSASLAGTLGVGNIVGVAVAVMLGGAGAVFWMWVSALLSMVLKFCEITLGLRYRVFRAGEDVGGPMYYMEKGIGGRGGRAFALIFSAAGVISSFAMGNIVQTSAASDAAEFIFGVPKWAFGIGFALLIALVVFGGFSRISRFTSIVLPIMAGMYLVLSLAIIIKNAGMVSGVFAEIFAEALKFDAAGGGVLGFFMSKNVANGIAKGTFSHEAGSGTAPMAHSGAENSVPARQGLLGLIEVAVDTLIMCTISALVILIAMKKGIASENAMACVLLSFENGIGVWSRYPVGISIFLFAFSSVICWAHYGRVCLEYISQSKKVSALYLVLYLICAVFGAVLAQDIVWYAADIGVAVMTFLNVPALFLLRGDIKKETGHLF